MRGKSSPDRARRQRAAVLMVAVSPLATLALLCWPDKIAELRRVADRSGNEPVAWAAADLGESGCCLAHSALHRKAPRNNRATLTLHVVGPGGETISDEPVWLCRGEPGLISFSDVVACGRSDEHGRIILRGLAPRRYSAIPLRGRRKSIDLTPGGRHHLRLRLEGHVAIEGTVIDPTGQPIPNAAILLTANLQVTTCRQIASTDATGHYRIENANPYRMITVQHPGYLSPRARLIPSGSTYRSFDFSLQPGHTRIRGFVCDGSSNVPLASAFVAAIGKSRNGSQPLCFVPLVQTDSTGQFEFVGLRPGGYRIQALSPDGRIANDSITLRVNDDIDRRLIAMPGRRVTGRVCFADESPVADAEIRAGSRDDLLFRQAKTADDGTYVLDDLPVSEIEFSVIHQDSSRLEQVGPDTATWSPVLDRIGHLACSVTTGDGNPVSAVSITLAKNNCSIRVCRTNEHGLGVFRCVPPGIYSLTATTDSNVVLGSLRDIVWDPARIREAGRSPAPLRLVLPTGNGTERTLAARLLQTSGAPIRRFWVRLRHLDPDDVSFVDLADPEGRLLVSDLSPGRYAVRIGARGFASATFDVCIPFAGGVDLGVVQLEAAVHVKLVDLGGHLRHQRVAVHCTSADTGLRYEFALPSDRSPEHQPAFDLRPGHYIVALEASGYSWRSRVEVRPAPATTYVRVGDGTTGIDSGRH